MLLLLIMFFDSNEMLNKSDFLDSIVKTQQIFNEADSIEENRVDAKLLSLICSYINNSINFDCRELKKFMSKLEPLFLK